MQKVVILTGASSGIGYDSAIKLAKQGHKVYAAARRVDLMQPLTSYGVITLRLDVTDDESMKKAVQTVLDAESRIDVLVNNAGYGYFGAVENVAMDEARRQLEVNVFGLARMCQLVLPVMRQQGRGLIVNTSSIAGKIVLPYGGWYHVSKFSVEALSDALRTIGVLLPLDICVSLRRVHPMRIQLCGKANCFMPHTRVVIFPLLLSLREPSPELSTVVIPRRVTVQVVLHILGSFSIGCFQLVGGTQ